MKILKLLGTILKYLWFALNAPGYFLLWLAYINPVKGNVQASARRWKNRHIQAPFWTFVFWFIIAVFLGPIALALFDGWMRGTL